MYSTGEVSALHKVSTQTVRHWCDEFGEYLSESATPGKGRSRQFTLDDMAVFDLIAGMKDAGHSFVDIHATLASGQRGEKPDLPPGELKRVYESEREQQARVEIENLRQALAKALEKAARTDELIAENERLKGRLEQIEQEIERARGKDEIIARLNQEIGKLQAKIEILGDSDG